MKLEVGMYVRTKQGHIYKLSRYEEDYNRWISSGESDWHPVYESLVTKASHNIVDLIEVGDYVNGWKVLYWTDGTKIVDDGYATNLDKTSVKSIVTKEQFESMSYKVGE